MTGPTPRGEQDGRGEAEVLVELRDLVKTFQVHGRGIHSGEVRAVDGVNLTIRRGETVALVGESGCGKSTLGRCMVRLHEPTSGTVLFEGKDLGALSGAELRRTRRHMQIIFQDPNSSLTPRMTVGTLLAEPLKVHKLVKGKQAVKDRVAELLELVGLLPDMADRYPHEFSGGQRQRIAIARALAHEPSFIVCDESVSALDVSIQAQILTLLTDLQKKLGLTYLFITHDLAVARYIADRIAVMYVGHMVELTDSATLFDAPAHPYTQGLISAVPVPDPVAERERERVIITGEPASPLHKPSGCVFHPRCPRADEECLPRMPRLEPYSAPAEPARAPSGHEVACVHPGSFGHTGGQHRAAEPGAAAGTVSRAGDRG